MAKNKTAKKKNFHDQERMGLWILAATLSLSSLAVCTSLLDPYTLPKLFSLAAGVVVSLIFWVWSRKKSVSVSPLFVPTLGIVAVACASVFFSADRAGGWLGAPELHAYGLAALFVYAALLWIVSSFSDEDLVIPWALTVIGAILGMSAIAQWSFGILLPGFATSLVNGRATALFGSPVYLGAVSALMAPYALDRALSSRGTRSLMAWSGFALVVVALLLSRSRGAWLAFSVGAGVYGLLRGGLPSRKQTAGVLAGLLFLGGLAGVIVIRRASDSDRARLLLWKTTVKVALSKPLLGVGPGAFKNALAKHADTDFIAEHGRVHIQAHAHNGILNAAATMGIAGIFAWIFFFFILIRSGRDRLREKGKSKGGIVVCALASLAAAIVQAQVNPLPVSAWAIAVYGAGRLTPISKRAPRWSEAAQLVALALCCASALGVWNAARADKHFLLAREAAHAGNGMLAVEEYKRVTQFAPWHVNAGQERVRVLIAISKNTGNKKTSHEYAKKAISAAREMVKQRPASGSSWFSLGFSLLAAKERGLDIPPLSVREAFLEASRRSWAYPGLLEARILFERAVGAIEEAARLQIELDRISKPISR